MDHLKCRNKNEAPSQNVRRHKALEYWGVGETLRRHFENEHGRGLSEFRQPHTERSEGAQKDAAMLQVPSSTGTLLDDSKVFVHS